MDSFDHLTRSLCASFIGTHWGTVVGDILRWRACRHVDTLCSCLYGRYKNQLEKGNNFWVLFTSEKSLPSKTLWTGQLPYKYAMQITCHLKLCFQFPLTFTNFMNQLDHSQLESFYTRSNVPMIEKYSIVNGRIRLNWFFKQIVHYVTIHHETSVKSPLGHFQFMLYLESTCPKL